MQGKPLFAFFFTNTFLLEFKLLKLILFGSFLIRLYFQSRERRFLSL